MELPEPERYPRLILIKLALYEIGFPTDGVNIEAVDSRFRQWDPSCETVADLAKSMEPIFEGSSFDYGPRAVARYADYLTLRVMSLLGVCYRYGWKAGRIPFQGGQIPDNKVLSD